MLQILFLDLGTDQLPALGLGIEPPGPHVLQQPPHRRHLLDAALLRRVFGVLGPTEAFLEMAAFGAVLLSGGWRLGEQPNPELLAAASGAAFATVVLSQGANAMACRSASRWPGALGWTRNRFLVASIAFELLLLVAFLFIPSIAHLLGQAPPPTHGWLIAALAVPAILGVDAAHKRWRAARSPADT